MLFQVCIVFKGLFCSFCGNGNDKIYSPSAGDEMEDIIKIAIQEANQKGIKGKDITPYILSKVAKNTEGRSLSTSILFKVMLP